MKNNILGIAGVLLVSGISVSAQEFNPPLNSDYVLDQTSVYVDDQLNSLTRLPSDLNCVLTNIGLGNVNLVNRIWNASYPEAKCHNADWEGMVNVVVSSSRASNSTPQELIAWMSFESAPIKYIMTLTMYESPEAVPPFGEFDMKFYQSTDDNVVPITHQDMASVSARAEENGVLLFSKRNNRQRDQYSNVKVLFQNDGSDIKIVGEDRYPNRTPANMSLIGLASENYVQASLADGSFKSCKSRDVNYAKTWNYNLYDFETGSEIELENGTVRIKFLEDDGTEAEYGRGHVSSSTYWFKDRRKGNTSSASFPAINEVSGEELSVIWSPAKLSTKKMLDVDVAAKDLKLTRGCNGQDYTIAYDEEEKVLLYDDQSIDADDCDVRMKNGKKYMPVYAEGKDVFSKLYDSDVSFRPSPENQGTDHQMVHPIGRVNVELPLMTNSELLSGTEVSPMVCVNDWNCPHVIAGVNEAAFGADDFDYFLNGDGLIEINGDKENEFFHPYTQTEHEEAWSLANGNQEREGFKKPHYYILTPLDTSELPTGTLPGTLYYDSNADGLLSEGELPIMTNLQHIHQKMNDDGSTDDDADEYLNGATGEDVTGSVSVDHEDERPRFSFDVVTRDDFESGCDGLDPEGEADHTFKLCDTKISYLSGPKDWHQKYYLKNEAGFIAQAPSLPVIYEFDPSDDLNQGYNDRIAELGGSRLSVTYDEGDWNNFTWERCGTDGGCTQEIGPEAMEGQIRMMNFAGSEFDSIPGARITMPGSSTEEWVPGVNFKNGTVFTDVFDANKKYVLKQVDYDQKLGALDTSTCAEASNGVAYNTINDEVFDGFQTADLPALDFDDELSAMPIWADLPASEANLSVCYVNEGELFGTCVDAN